MLMSDLWLKGFSGSAISNEKDGFHTRCQSSTLLDQQGSKATT